MADLGVAAQTYGAAVPPLRRAHRLLLFAAVVFVASFELISVIHFVRESKDFIVARREGRLHLYTLGERVTWRGQSRGQIYGWTRPDPHGAWSIGPRASLAVRILDPQFADLQLVVLADGLIDASRISARSVSVAVNKRDLAQWRFDTPGPVTREVRIPRDVIADERIVRVDFRIDHSRSPRTLGLSGDTRALGFRVIEWQLTRMPG
jgi:hypothetical protein